jgi:beta-glucuronidase
MPGLHSLITWTTSRAQQSLNGSWNSIIDVYDVGSTGPFGADEVFAEMFGFQSNRGRNSPGRRAEYDFDTSPVIEVPGDWNTQHERFHYYEGSMWFRRLFDANPKAGRRQFVYVGAANHTTQLFLNGKRIADHEGGYGPWCVEVSGMLKTGENVLIARVNNQRTADAIPTTRTDWFNYGGITRDVLVFDVPETFIRDAVVQLNPANAAQITVEVRIDGSRPQQDVRVSVAGVQLGTLRTGADGTGSAAFPTPPSLALWSPSNPTLNEVVVSSETDSVTDLIGFRTVRTEGAKILLNGEPIFLAGISLHDEALGEPAHRIQTKEQALEVLAHVKALGANFVRLAHYQHNEITVRACDELGLLAWCEVPVYWAINWENPDTLSNAKLQLTELIERDRNRAAVAMWSVANETPVVEPRLHFLRALIDLARKLDPSRLVTAALFSRPEGGHEMSFNEADGADAATTWVIDDPLGELVDVLGVNEYHGWYYGTIEHMAKLSWTSPYDKPLIISEFGGDAKFGLRGDPNESWTEDLQAEIYKAQLDMQSRIPFLAGISPWILKDFRAPFRLLPGVQDGFNRKGLIDDLGNHKLAFDILAAHYAARRSRGELGTTAVKQGTSGQ